MNELGIKLRSICNDDAIVLMELNNSRLIADYVVGNPEIVNMEQQLNWIEKTKHETNTKRWMIDFEGKAVGTIILSSIDYYNLVGNMNIKILPDFQGKGIAKRALLMACDIAFDELELFCLTANVLSFNSKSRMLFLKAGFREDGVLRSRIIKNGQRHDLISFSLLKSERSNKTK